MHAELSFRKGFLFMEEFAKIKDKKQSMLSQGKTDEFKEGEKILEEVIDWILWK